MQTITLSFSMILFTNLAQVLDWESPNVNGSIDVAENTV